MNAPRRRALADALARLPDGLPLLALVAVAGARLVPSASATEVVDPLLAALVLATALDIDPDRLLAVRTHVRLIAVLAVVPLLLLAGLAWILSASAPQPTRIGIVAVGLSPTEVASVGLVGLMAGPAELAVAVLAGSLIVSAVLGPALLGVLAPGGTAVNVGGLLGRFALVVLVPLAVGLLARRRRPGPATGSEALSGLASLLVVGLIYASLAGTGGGDLGAPILYSALFLLVSGLVAAVAVITVGRHLDRSLALPIAMRDFAVAAALATAVGGAAASRVTGIYGVLMLFGGAGCTGFVRLRRRRSGSPARAS